MEIKQDFINEEIKPEEDKNVGIEKINRDFTANANVSLINVINISSIIWVKIVDFFKRKIFCVHINHFINV